MLFEHLSKVHEEDTERENGSRAILIAKHRFDKNYAEFVKKAQTAMERNARIGLLIDDLESLVKEAANEFNSPLKPVREALMAYASSTKLACKDCDCDNCDEGKCSCDNCPTCKGKESRTAGDTGTSEQHAECPHCGSADVVQTAEREDAHMLKCNSCGKRSDFDKETEKISRWHLAEKKLPGWNEHQKSDRGAVFGEDGGQYAMGDVKTIDSKDGLGDQGAVKTDHKRVPEDGLKPVAIDSKEHPGELQSVEERWTREYSAEYNDVGPADTSEKAHEFIDVEAPIGDTTAYPTQTWQGDTINPVTSAISKWHIA